MSHTGKCPPLILVIIHTFDRKYKFRVAALTKSTEGEWTEPVTTKTSAPQASEPANEREIQKSKWSIQNLKKCDYWLILDLVSKKSEEFEFRKNFV